MDDERKRKKCTLYLHPEKAADFQTLEAIESVPRSERGELFRNAFISGMALLNRPGFPGECFICELRLPDHRF